jgi:hypothetical protein
MAKSKSNAETRIAIAVYESLRIVETRNLEDLSETALLPIAEAAEALRASLESVAEPLS